MWGENTEKTRGTKKAKISSGVKSHLFKPALRAIPSVLQAIVVFAFAQVDVGVERCDVTSVVTLQSGNAQRARPGRSSAGTRAAAAASKGT